MIEHQSCNTEFYGDIYTYQEGKKIYFFNTNMDSFQMLYNFNAKIGDSWEISSFDFDSVLR